LADALNGIGCTDERTHKDVRAGKHSMDGCSRLVALCRAPARSYTRKESNPRRGWRGKDRDVVLQSAAKSLDRGLHRDDPP
jgi:hypothetical protein